MRILFDTYAPDMAPEVLGSAGLLTATNAWKEPSGYRRAGGWNQVSTIHELYSRVCGSFLAYKTTGVSHLMFVGTTNDLWTLEDLASDWIDRSSVGAYNVSAGEKWDFAQYDNSVVAVCGDVDAIAPQNFLMSGGASANFAALSADAPYARHVGTIGQHLVLGYVKGRGAGSAISARNAVWWSTIGNHTSWPQPGTAAAVAAQSDYRILAGNGGDVTAIIGRADSGFVFQRQAIWQMYYVGGSTMFEFNNITDERGCVFRGCVVDTPAGIFFIDYDGLYRLSSDGVEPVGVGKFRKTMSEDIRDFAFLDENAQLIADPSTTRFYFLVPKSGNNTAYVYDWALDEVTLIDEAYEWLVPVRTTTQYVFPRLGAFREGEQRLLGTISDSVTEADLLDAVFETGDIEPNPGGTATLKSVRPLAQGNTFAGTLKVSARYKLSDSITWSGIGAKTLNEWEEYDCDEDGRYFRFQMTWATGVGTVTGIDAEFVPSGDR